MIKVTAIVLVLSAALSTVLSQEEKCNEQLLTECLKAGVQFTVHQFDPLASASVYCEAAEEGEKCMNISKRCIDKQPQKTKTISSYAAHLIRICTAGGIGYENFSACFQKHLESDESKKCSSAAGSGYEDPVKHICLEIDAMQCHAKLVHRECENVEPFGTVFEKSVAALQMDVCNEFQATTVVYDSSAVIFADNIWILVMTLCVLFSVRNKF